MTIELVQVEAYRGDTEPIGFTVHAADGSIPDITGRTYRLGISRVKHPQAGEASAVSVASLVGVVLNGPAGLVGFSPLTSTFDGLQSREFIKGVASLWYDLEQTDGASIQTLGTGSFLLYQDISK